MTAPWSELDAVYLKDLRTSNLVESLSSILSDLISKRLPKIQDEVEKSIQKAQELLGALPKAPSPRNEILTLLHEFTNDISKHVEGVPDEDRLLKAIRPAQERLRRSIRGTAPKFPPFERKYRGTRKLGKLVFLVNEEGESVGGDEDDEQEDLGEGRVTPMEGGNVDQGTSRKRKYQDIVDVISIDEGFERAHRARTRELLGNYPFVVQVSFINSIKEWCDPAIILCKTIHATIMEHCKKLVLMQSGEFGQGAVQQRVKAIIQKHVNDCLQRAENKVNWLLQLEDKPFSPNNHYLADYKSKFLSYYKGVRERDEQSELIKAIEAFDPNASNSNSIFAQSKANTFSFQSATTSSTTPSTQLSPAFQPP